MSLSLSLAPDLLPPEQHPRAVSEIRQFNHRSPPSFCHLRQFLSLKSVADAEGRARGAGTVPPARVQGAKPPEVGILMHSVASA